jgi:hypothetical protein
MPQRSIGINLIFIVVFSPANYIAPLVLISGTKYPVYPHRLCGRLLVDPKPPVADKGKSGAPWTESFLNISDSSDSSSSQFLN